VSKRAPKLPVIPKLFSQTEQKKKAMIFLFSLIQTWLFKSIICVNALSPSCDPGLPFYYPIEDTWIKVSTERKTHSEAKSICESEGSTQAMPKTRAIHNYILDISCKK